MLGNGLLLCKIHMKNDIKNERNDYQSDSDSKNCTKGIQNQ